MEKIVLEELMKVGVNVLVLGDGKPIVGYPGAEVGIEDDPVTASVLPVEKAVFDRDVVKLRVLLLGISTLVAGLEGR